MSSPPRKWIDSGPWDAERGNRIVRILCDAYPSPDAVAKLLEDSGLGSDRMPTAFNLNLQWFQLTRHLCGTGELRRLLDTAVREYPALAVRINELDTVAPAYSPARRVIGLVETGGEVPPATKVLLGLAAAVLAALLAVVISGLLGIIVIEVRVISPVPVRATSSSAPPTAGDVAG